MPIIPGPGSSRSMRHRNGWARSSVGGRLERLDVHALRIDHADGVPDHAALAGGVHPLQHDQDARRAGLAGPTGREQPLLQVAELGRDRGLDQPGRRPCLPREPRRGARDRTAPGRPARRAAAAARSAGLRLRRLRPHSSVLLATCRLILPYVAPDRSRGSGTPARMPACTSSSTARRPPSAELEPGRPSSSCCRFRGAGRPGPGCGRTSSPLRRLDHRSGRALRQHQHRRATSTSSRCTARCATPSSSGRARPGPRATARSTSPTGSATCAPPRDWRLTRRS